MLCMKIPGDQIKVKYDLMQMSLADVQSSFEVQSHDLLN